MYKYLLSDLLGKDIVKQLSNYTYYALINIGIVAAIYLIYRRMKGTGADIKRLRIFVIYGLIISYPAGIISSRAASMFYYPMDLWSFSFFIEKFMTKSYHTYHACLILPFIMLSIGAVVLKLRFWHVWDSIFVYIPFGHAVGRLGCLLVGCCWGRPVSFTLFSHHFEFNNPTPLYAIITNLLICFLLGHLHTRVYGKHLNKDNDPEGSATGGDPGLQNRDSIFSGSVFAFYFIIYGFVRFLYEFIRTEDILAWGLTQAQIAMIGYILTGSVIILSILIRHRGKILRVPDGARGHYLALPGAIVTFLASFLILVLIFRDNALVWPFHRSSALAGAFSKVLTYAPVFMVACLSMLWMKLSRLEIIESFKWKRFSYAFFAAAAISVAYAVQQFIAKGHDYQGIAFLVPAILMCAMNAAAEEVFYRLVLMDLLEQQTGSFLFSNIIQSAFYAVVHIPIGGLRFAAFAFIYGMILGLVRRKSRSVTPCIICHFIVDLGAIGIPMMIR